MEIGLKENERLVDLERNGYRIIQNQKGFCFGIDAVLLSGFAQVKAGEQVLDLGTGTGIIPILLEAKTKGEHFTGLEIQEESVDMAGRSVKLNGLTEKIEIVQGDIKEASKIFGGAAFHVVTTNPPYMTEHHGVQNEADAKTIARHEILCNLEDVVREGAKVLTTRGRFYMVHRPRRLADIISLMRKYQLEPKRIRMVHPFVDKEANMVLIEGVKNGGTMMKVEAPLVVYEEPGVFTEEIHRIYGF
ncbi:MAG: tRNA1(Val) (adenine(37)-N6)-methyltransferase [Eubacterium sp.]|nr:tRNA1(Val) (adenine(37)-N6)-methyltransferase [Eubacterium sp.]